MKRRVIPVVLILLAMVGLLGWRIWQQQVELNGPAGGSGVIEGRELRLSSRVGGRVEEIMVKEGQEVRAGDVVLRLDCIEPKAALAEAEARLAAGREQAVAGHRAADAARSAAGAATAVAKAAKAQAQAVETQGSAAQRQASRLDAVKSDVSTAQRDQARAAADAATAQAKAASLQRSAGSAQAQAASDQAGAALAQAAAADKQIVAGEAALERARVAVEECVVKAPSDGMIQLLPYELGELVPPGLTLASMVDISVAKAAFYLPNADLAAARPGGSAEVRADAWPDRVFHGAISTIATQPEFTPRNIQTRTDRDRLVYRVEVSVDNPDSALRPGMPVVVRLVGDKP